MQSAITIAVCCALAATAADDTNSTARRVPVLVELFTSQGCSSCPPADELLARLAAQQPVKGAEIIVLSEHVDYWNYIGWKDPYSSAQFTTRQQDYGRLFGVRGAYTPQMVVNGRVELVGSDLRTARREVERATEAASRVPPANVRALVERVDAKNVASLALKIDKLPALNEGDTAVVWLAVTESALSNPVQAGENKGRTSSHAGVVRTLVHRTNSCL